jgi:drug/metabolite transporter (DMT)-like permease
VRQVRTPFSWFTNGLTVCLIRHLSPENNPFTPFFYMSGIGCLVAAGPLFLQESPLLIGAMGAIGLVAIATFAATAHLLFNKALVYLPSPRAGVISMLEVLFGGVCGFFIFYEPLTWRLILGGSLIIGSWLIGLFGFRRKFRKS